MSQIIPPNIVEPSEILKSLQAYINSKPEDQRWVDQYEGAAGQTLLELIAGLGGFDAFHRIALRRELSLDQCVADSSIREHAFNRGVLTGTSNTLSLRLYFKNTNPIQISSGQLIGQIGDYELYSTESKEVTSDFTLDVAAGHLFENTVNMVPKKFGLLTYGINDPYVAHSLESLSINDTVIPLKSELSYMEKYNNGFLLRRVTPGEVRVYLGNGVLGWYESQQSRISYRCLSYDRTLSSVVGLTPEIFISPTLTSHSILTMPEYGVDGETLRATAIYYPLDGRICQDSDYDGVIMAHFGGVIYDAFSYNTDPDQVVRILPRSDFSEVVHKPQIAALVDSRRGLGIRVDYQIMDISEGQVLNLDLKCVDFTAYQSISPQVLAYIRKDILKFMRSPRTIRCTDIASDITHRYGIKFYGQPGQIYNLAANQFIRDFNIQVNAL